MSKWSKEKRERLKEVCSYYTLEELAKIFCTSEKSIIREILFLGYTHEEVTGNLQKCNKCKNILHLDNFNKRSRTRRGKNSICKECMRKYKKQRYNKAKEKIGNNEGTIWSKEDEELLKKIYKLYTYEELAVTFKRTKNAIYTRILKLKLIEKEEIPKGSKKCPKCKEILELDKFYKMKNGKPYFICKNCNKLYTKERSINKMVETEQKEKKIKIEEYKKELEHQELFCKKCNSKKEIDDYYFRISKDGTVNKLCKDCNKRSNQKYELKRARIKGY